MISLKKMTRTLAVLPIALLGACSHEDGSRVTGSPENQGTSKAALTSYPSQKQVAGCWRITQGSYYGVLNLRQEGGVLKGFMDWNNHIDAIAEGTLIGDQVDLNFIYLPPKGTLVGNYKATLSADGRSFLGTTGGTVRFSAYSQACAELSGCWKVRQGDYSGTLNLVWKSGGYVTGFMDWGNTHASASVSGTVSSGKLSLTFAYRGEKEGVYGRYDATVSPDRMHLMDGLTWDTQFPDDKHSWYAHSTPCKDIAGCFAITQTNADGGIFTGIFKVARTAVDTILTGASTWTGHPDGVLNGSLPSRHVSFTQTFPGTSKEGLVGYYTAVIDPQGDFLSQGKTSSNTGDAGTFTGSRALCPLP